jgi:hypothetical protein
MDAQRARKHSKAFAGSLYPDAETVCGWRGPRGKRALVRS